MQTTIPTHPAGQGVLFPSPVEVVAGPLTLILRPTLQRLPRQRCCICGNRRVCFVIGVGEELRSAPMCAKCASIR
jgi:hypothetical protein